MREIEETLFVNKVLRIVNGELHQIEKLMENLQGDEIQLAFFRGERSRLLQMKGIFEEYQQELKKYT